MDETNVIQREKPDVAEARKALVTSIQDDIRAAKKRWEQAFKRMKADRKFARGRQWSDDLDDDRYVANLVLRHVQQRTAAVYAKNPRVIARRKKRLNSILWDGNEGTLAQAQQIVQTVSQATMDPVLAAQVPPDMLQQAMMAQEIVAEAARVREQEQMLDRIAETLAIVYQHNVDEQAHKFKSMMKMVVRRAITTGVGYVKLGFQRMMQMRPDVEARIADMSEQLATVERLSADLADGEIEQDSAQAEQLKLALQKLQAEPQILVREGLVFDYPDSLAIIPDAKCKQLREFLGCDMVTEEYFLSTDAVKEIYGVDVKAGAHVYGRSGETRESAEFIRQQSRPSGSEFPTGGLVCVWETYSRKDGLVYTTCDGWPDFLREPAAPDVTTERFWPWYPIVTNECDDPDDPFPPSDVRLLRDMQMEHNRARQGLREQRRANRPKIFVAAGLLDDEDKDKLRSHPANAVLEMNGLQPGQKIEDVLQSGNRIQPGIDPNLYEVGPIWEDVFRTVGAQEANFGGTSDSTATEAGIAESSRMSALSSFIDELDELLTDLARNGGQVLLKELQPETVTKIVGEGAVWPDMDREAIVSEIFLEIEAGSSGRPNRAQEVQNFRELAPLLMQIPGIDPERLAREGIRRMDDRLDPADMMRPGAPSIASMNRMSQVTAAGPENDPNNQGAAGGDNDPKARNPRTASRPQAPTGAPMSGGVPGPVPGQI